MLPDYISILTKYNSAPERNVVLGLILVITVLILSLLLNVQTDSSLLKAVPKKKELTSNPIFMSPSLTLHDYSFILHNCLSGNQRE